MNTLSTFIDAPLRYGKLSSEGIVVVVVFRHFPGPGLVRNRTPFLIIAFDADSMLRQLDLRVRHLSNAASLVIFSDKFFFSKKMDFGF